MSRSAAAMAFGMASMSGFVPWRIVAGAARTRSGRARAGSVITGMVFGPATTGRTVSDGHEWNPTGSGRASPSAAARFWQVTNSTRVIHRVGRDMRPGPAGALVTEPGNS
ncbi:hypothetical protein ACWZEH_15110 [Streptomyces sp. QTS137]